MKIYTTSIVSPVQKISCAAMTHTLGTVGELGQRARNHVVLKTRSGPGSVPGEIQDVQMAEIMMSTVTVTTKKSPPVNFLAAHKESGAYGQSGNVLTHVETRLNPGAGLVSLVPFFHQILVLYLNVMAQPTRRVIADCKIAQVGFLHIINQFCLSN